MQAVFDSRVEQPYRQTLLALAWFANDDGREIRPGAELVAQMLCIKERAVRDHMQVLAGQIGVLVPAGYHRHTRRFSLNFDALSAYLPPSVNRRTAREQLRSALQDKPCTSVQGSSLDKPCTSVPTTLHGRAIDPYESKDPSLIRQEQTARVARECVPGSKKRNPSHSQLTDQAKGLRRRRYGGCPHEPKCSTYVSCIQLMVQSLANRKAI